MHIDDTKTPAISTHTPHARRDVLDLQTDAEIRIFQLTRLMRGVTQCDGIADIMLYISTHTPHARRDAFAMLLTDAFYISTHTPHARRDKAYTQIYDNLTISTHTPHARRDIIACSLIPCR